jgi:NAD(P)-dependent dehydrogenase (short-subunit alcohol dehydrogenase family)
MPARLTDRVAIVTGAGGGLGEGISHALASEGARVVVLGRRRSACERVADEIAAQGGVAFAEQCDILDRAEVDASVARIVEQLGGIDILVNNAQATSYASIRKSTEAELELMWQTGPMATFRFLQACFPHLRERKGCVVNLGSGSSILPQGAMGGYAMAKEAIRVLTRVAALEWGRHGIRVNAVCPLALTPGFTAFGDALPGAVEEAVEPLVPLGRIGDAELDVGPGVVYLCSDDARYVTGTTLMVDGGYNFLR